MTLKDYAIKAFQEGSDNYGETVVGTRDLYFNTGGIPHYAMTVLLKEPSGHPCTSGIGFYPMENNPNQLKVVSGHRLPWVVDITPEIQAELDAAPVYQW